MTSPALTPKEKYPKALALFREALKVDPKNKVALENKNMIEQIYKSMGRPIPKG
jgi:tetratricopeptide (TPR) repeat protein